MLLRAGLERRAEPVRARVGAGAAGPAIAPNLKNMGGKVLTRPSLSMLYLGSYWRTERGASERQHIDGFARTYEQSPVQGVLAQYGAGPARFAGTRVIDGVAPRFVNRGTVRELVMDHVRRQRLDRDPQRIYSVLLPPGVILGDGQGTTSLKGMAGYHGSFLDHAGRPVYYAAIAYSGSLGRNGINFNGRARDAITVTLSHEWAEAVTDPDVEHHGTAWYDKRLGEIGDLAITQLPLQQSFEFVNGYAQQKLWSNRDQRYETAPLRR